MFISNWIKQLWINFTQVDVYFKLNKITLDTFHSSCVDLTFEYKQLWIRLTQVVFI